MPTMQAHFERVERIWVAPANQTRLANGIATYGYNWTHSNFDWLKIMLQRKLRLRQQDRCCYCRRALVFDKGHVELDHIIDKGSNKGQYERFTFEIRNLALACKDCNNNKGTKAVLSTALSVAAEYPKKTTAYVWVHPHIHKYSDHIIIHQGWVYEAKNGSAEGHAVITKCMLHKLKDKERANRRVIVSGAKDLKVAVARAVGLVGEVGLDSLCRELGDQLALKWNSTPAEVDGAIRSLHASVQALPL